MSVEKFLKANEPSGRRYLKLEKYKDEILSLRNRDFSYPQIQSYLIEFHKVKVTRQSIGRFVKANQNYVPILAVNEKNNFSVTDNKQDKKDELVVQDETKEFILMQPQEQAVFVKKLRDKGDEQMRKHYYSLMSQDARNLYSIEIMKN